MAITNLTASRKKLESMLEITFTPVAQGAHEPQIKRDIQTNKERARCTFAGIPFKQMPPRMTIELVIGVYFWLNYWCSSGRVSKTMSPRQIFTGIKLDATKYCKFQFGDYSLAHRELDNTMKL